MSEMPETVWLEDEFGDGHEDQGSYGSWDCRNAYGYVHEYLRADIAAAQVAAAYERGAELFDEKHHVFMVAKGRNPSDYMSEFSNAADKLRALATDTQTNALEQVRKEARKEVISENDLYYLRAIQRRMGEFRDALDGLEALSIGGEAFADERDWLNCFIGAKTALLDNPTPDPDEQTG